MSDIGRCGPGAKAGVVVAALVAAAIGWAGPAQAQLALSVLPELPTEVTVGQRNVAGRLTIENQTIGGGAVRLGQILYDPACRDLTLPCGAPDPGVFVLSSNAVGAAGACAGRSFLVTGDGTTGRYTFVPQAVPIDLQPPGSAGSSCVIDFRFDVARQPTTVVQPPPPSVLTRTVVTVVAQRGTEGSTNFGTANVTVKGVAFIVGRYVPLTPARVLDTRNGTGGVAGPVGPDATVGVQITGRAGVPDTGVTAVAMNVTVTEPTGSGFLTVFPSATARPIAANLNFTPGKTVPNMVVVKLGASGRVDMYNSDGATHVVYDVAGYFADDPTGPDGRYQPLLPARILDTRTGVGGFAVRLGPGASLDLQVTGQGGVPTVGAQGVVMNVAVTNTTEQSYLTVYPTGGERPLAANLNWVAGDTNSNRVFAKLGTGGRVTIFNADGQTDIIVDANGWFTDSSQAGSSGAYVALTPARLVDTRTGTGGIPGPRPGGSVADVQVTGQAGVPASGVSAVILNATVVGPSGPGFLTLFPSASAVPLASDLNYATGEIRPNLVVVKLGDGGKVSLYTPVSTHVVLDVAGYIP